MLMRLDWQDPRDNPPQPRRRPGRLLAGLFWTCIVLCILCLLLLF